MMNEDETVYIVFNGEIYNYRELRDRVSHHSFKSETDTEVLLHLYEEEGTDCLSLLRGMFAFAIWDEARERLFLARDRLGQKPLFYYSDETAFRFGSTIKAVLADDAIDAVPDPDALRSYLTYQYVPHPWTGFQDIRRISPGEYMVVTPDSIHRDQYWQLSYADQFTDSPSTLANRLRNEFRDAVKLRMRSDVPLGVFLSGGIDSTVVTAVMADLAEGPIETYSIGFDEYDELEFARAVAEKYDTNHHEYTVTPDVRDVLPELVDHYEMPFGDPSALPTYYVSQMAAEDITVAVGGDAGDENFAGYDRYMYDKATAIANRAPQSALKVGGRLLERAPGPQFARRAGRLLENAQGGAVERYAPYICHMDQEDVEEIWTGDQATDQFEYLRAAFDQTDGPTRLDQLMQVDINTYLPDDLLVKVDRASMAHSLEVRSPFLDHKFMEFTARIPAKYKLRKNTKKWILKRAFDDVFPETVRGRSKQGFSVPVDAWFRGELREFGRDQLDKLGHRSLFYRDGLMNKFEAHVTDDADYGHHLWDLMMLEQWYERFIDSN